MSSVFLICPITNATEEQSAAIAKYVSYLEVVKKRDVHWPARDTQQNRPVMDIFHDNRAAMMRAQEVHVWWNPNSTGSKFDLGMAYALSKPILIANPQEVQPTFVKSFENFLIDCDGTWNHNLGEESEIEDELRGMPFSDDGPAQEAANL